MKLAILGAGSMGTACSLILSAQPELEVALWTRNSDHAEAMQRDCENKKHFPGYPLPEALQVTSDVAAATVDSDLIVAAIPTVYLREALTPIASAIPAKVPMASVAKGLEQETFRRPSEIILELLGERSVASLTGPSHAEELAQGLPASVVVASQDIALAQQVQQTFTTERLRLYTNTDLVGAELGGALKNVIAIAAGVCDGMKLGDNAKAALLTRGLVEMVRFGTRLGGSRETFYGLAGIGDLITTCISPYGRNLNCGRKLGSGMKLTQILESTQAVAEGVWTSRAVRAKAEALGIEMPITVQVTEILFEEKDPRDAVHDLMVRELKSEWPTE